MPAHNDDVVELIKADHREVEKLFARVESDDTPTAEKATLLATVAEQLVAHSKAEEDVAYPDIRAAAPREGDEVTDGVAEHHHIEGLLEQLRGMSLDDPGADGILAAVIAETRHHVEEEEQDVLPAYVQKSDEARRAEVGRRFRARKQQELGQGAGSAAQPASIDLTTLTKDELYERAKERGVEGRSDMTKDELIAALRE